MKTFAVLILTFSMTACTGGLKTQRLEVKNFDKQG